MATAQRAPSTVTGEQLRRRANLWFADELQRAQKAQGAAWERHREWVEAYLLAEVRQRLQRASHA